MRGHEEASGTKYVPPELFEEWKQKDPLVCFEKFLLDEGVLRPEWVPYLRNEFTTLIDAEVEKVFSEPDITPHYKPRSRLCTACSTRRHILHLRLAPINVTLMP
jgi:TPP-dependent pyruvate/acetoin dehydrogenase alpha subunit